MHNDQINLVSQPHLKQVLQTISKSIEDFRNGEPRSLITLEKWMSDLVGLELTTKIMNTIRSNIDMDVPTIIKMVKGDLFDNICVTETPVIDVW